MMDNFELHKTQASRLLEQNPNVKPDLLRKTLAIIIELCEEGQKLKRQNAELKNQLWETKQYGRLS